MGGPGRSGGPRGRRTTRTIPTSNEPPRGGGRGRGEGESPAAAGASSLRCQAGKLAPETEHDVQPLRLRRGTPEHHAAPAGAHREAVELPLLDLPLRRPRPPPP